MTTTAVLLGIVMSGPLDPSGQTLSALVAALPQRIAGYAVVEEATYTPETVFDYLNGGAEIYLSYGMEAVLGRRYAHPEEPDLLLDVFDLGSSENAFGMFSQEQENPTGEIGQTSEYTPGLLRFWKGRFFVAVTATGLTDGATAATLALGRACAAAVAREGVQPELLNSLPAEGLVEARVRFVRTASALSRHYDLVGGDLLGLERDARVVLAEYERQGGRAVLLLVEYPDPDRAERAERSFLEQYGPAERTEVFQRPPTLAWSTLVRRGGRLALVLEAPDAEMAGALAAEVEAIWQKESKP